MIQLRPDYLIIQTADGEQIPCSAEWLTLEILGGAAAGVDTDMVQHASAAVLHYFKHEREQNCVSVGEFASALERVLLGLGWGIEPKPVVDSPRVVEMDLCHLASGANGGCELFFFPSLREELKRKLKDSPQVVRFRGLRPCVKQLAGTNRWNRRCQTLNDQIVDYLRTCWHSEAPSASCALVVQ